MKRWILRIAILSLGGLIALGITVLLIARHMGSGTLQEWIGSQIQDIANSHLNPKLTFTDLAYQYPLDVSLKNLHLTADDPAHPGHTIDIIACDRAEISLAEIPSIGKPIIIQKIALDNPLISAVALEPGSKKFVGFSTLIRGASDTPASDNSSTAPKKLSDVFRMRLVQITDGKIVYDPRIPGTVPMTLDQINTVLNIKPTDDGWYKLDTDIVRKPVFDLSLKGELNLDSFSVRGADISLLADLGQDKLDYLPPEIQSLLKQYDAKGKLTIELTGDMPLTDPMQGRAQASVTLDRANIAMAGLQIPVDNLTLKTRFENGQVYLPLLRISALGGTADLSGAVTLNDRLDSNLHLNIAGMVPEKLLADPAMASPYPARLDLDFNMNASIMSVLGKAPVPTRSPLAVIGLRDFRLSSVDPVHPDQRLSLLACQKLTVGLTQPILPGKPIVIDQIILDRPVISAVSVSPGSMQFVGIPNFPSRPAPQTAAPTTEPFAPMPKLADIIQVKTFQLNDAKIIYDPRIPNTQRMSIDQIYTSLNIDPADPGSYKISTTIDRSPGFKLDVEGEANIDNPGLQNLTVDLHTDLSQENLDFLPPQLQLVLKQFNAKESLDLHAATTVSLSDLTKADVQLKLDVQNIDLNHGNLRLPINDVAIDARVQDGVLHHTVKISALNQFLDFHGTTKLNNRLDSDVTLNLSNVDIQSILAALNPNSPAPTGSTTLNAQIEVQSPIMVAIGTVPGSPGQPIATATIRNLRLTADDPETSGKTLDFFACNSISASLGSLPSPNKPIEIDRIDIQHPAIRAIAVSPHSTDFAGFVDLQHLAPAQSNSSPTGAPATEPAAPETKLKLSNIFRMQSLAISDASIYYDPRIETTTPMSFDQIAINIDLDSLAGDAYRFDILVPSKPQLNLELAGRANIDSLTLDPLKLYLTTELDPEITDLKYLPPQLQLILRPFDPQAKIRLTAIGSVPLTNPMACDVLAYIALDHVKATTGDYRIPLDQIRLPLRYHSSQLDFHSSSPMGGPTLTAFNGTANLTGSILLNDRLDTTLSLKEDGMLLQSLFAAKITEPRPALIGQLKAHIELVDAPVLTIIAEATPPAATEPSTTPSQTESTASSASPKYLTDLPASWGSAEINLTHARLAGLELFQGMGNLAKSAFADVFDKKNKDKPQTIIPKETASVTCDFVKDRISITQMHYEGEDIAADGKGYITLSQYLDLYLTGGLFQKLGGMGAVGDWIKQASDSLLYYHVYGNVGQLKFEAKRGNGQPIVNSVKKGATIAEKGINTGLQQADKGLHVAGSFINGLFHHKKSEDQPQTQPSN